MAGVTMQMCHLHFLLHTLKTYKGHKQRTRQGRWDEGQHDEAASSQEQSRFFVFFYIHGGPALQGSLCGYFNTSIP